MAIKDLNEFIETVSQIEGSIEAAPRGPLRIIAQNPWRHGPSITNRSLRLEEFEANNAWKCQEYYNCIRKMGQTDFRGFSCCGCDLAAHLN